MKRKLLLECLSIATKNNPKHPESDCYRHFSFIIQKNKIVTWGTNRRSSPLTFLGYPAYSKMHSEIDAYYKAKGIMDRTGFEVINIRLTKSNNLKESTPCKCCYAFLKHLGCNRIWFSTSMGNFAVITS
jgi:tRNA(Arg) A34 adenosine deaminase TadA